MMAYPRMPDDWSEAALVVAHPDDEILWFSSCVESVSTIVICFHEVLSKPHWTEGRDQSIERFPLSNAIFLRLTQAEVFDAARWPNPELTEFGVRVSNKRGRSQEFSERLYEANFSALRNGLRKQLVGRKIVITHNPWGEYGHEEHIQVFRAVLSLKEEIGFEVWCSNYLSAKSQDLFLKWVPRLDPTFVRASTNRAISEQIKEIYSEHGCWTWFPDYQWPPDEAFFRIAVRDGLPQEGDGSEDMMKYGAVFPLNYILVKGPPPRAGIKKRAQRAFGRLRRFVRAFFG